MLNIGGANTVCQRSHRAMSRGVRITADNCHARQGRTLLWTHDMNNTLPLIIKRYFGYLVFRTIIIKSLQLNARYLVFNAGKALSPFTGLGGDIMIRHCNVGTDSPGLAPREPEPFKSLR